MAAKQLVDTKTLVTGLATGLIGILGTCAVFVVRESARAQASEEVKKDEKRVAEILGRANKLSEELQERDKESAGMLVKIRENRAQAASNAGAIEALARDKANEVAKALATSSEFVRLTAESVASSYFQKLEHLEGRITEYESGPNRLGGAWYYNGDPRIPVHIHEIGNNALLLVNENHAPTFGVYDPSGRKLTAFPSNLGWGENTATLSQDGMTITSSPGSTTWKRGPR